MHLCAVGVTTYLFQQWKSCGIFIPQPLKPLILLAAMRGDGRISMQAHWLTWRTHTHHPSRHICGKEASSCVPPTTDYASDSKILHFNAVVWLCWCWWGGQGSSAKKGKRGLILEELLSAHRGQPKGRILVLESGRGEEGWNHVSVIPHPPRPHRHPPLLSSPDLESINSFNPVFLWIRLAFWATAALFSNHSPRGGRQHCKWGERQ